MEVITNGIFVMAVAGQDKPAAVTAQVVLYLRSRIRNISPAPGHAAGIDLKYSSCRKQLICSILPGFDIARVLLIEKLILLIKFGE